MIIIGMLFVVLSAFILYTRVNLILFGKSAKGVIVGYGNCTEGIRGAKAYNYRVKYKFDNKEYYAYSLESISFSSNTSRNKNIHKEVEVYFKPGRYNVVTIKEFKGTVIIGFICLLFGIMAFALSFI